VLDANIDEEKREIYNHTTYERENKRKGEKKCNGFFAMHF
jgi:hypothetical protein